MENTTEARNLETQHPGWFKIIDGVTYIRGPYGLQEVVKVDFEIINEED
tara:strand:+ start:175 stop:321 length:147 start_codon:yes stop_codon:yes gene_type:complete